MFIEKLEKLFQQYQIAFMQFDAKAVSHCYQLPCSLSTPDQMLIIENSTEFEQEFETIFQQLQQANTTEVKATQASCLALSETLVLTCIDWAFVDNTGNIFADFSAFYHLVYQEDSYKIISVSSQDLSQSKMLEQTLDIEHK